MRCRVVVGNIGTVFDGDDVNEAKGVFDEYTEHSKAPHGRASRESVVMFCDNEIEEEYYPDDGEEY